LLISKYLTSVLSEIVRIKFEREPFQVHTVHHPLGKKQPQKTAVTLRAAIQALRLELKTGLDIRMSLIL
jgi:hypothetical protein